MVSLLWGFRKDPELTTQHQTTPLTCLFSHFKLKDKFMYLPYLSALLLNLPLLWYLQSLLRVSMSTAIRAKNLGPVLSASIMDKVWLLPQHPFLPFPIVHSPLISCGESLLPPCIRYVVWVEFTVPPALMVGSDSLESINIVPSLLPQRLAQRPKPFSV